MIAAAPLAEVDATIAALRTSSLVGGAILLVLLTAVGWFALGRGLRPLRRIEQTAAAIADGDLTRRVPTIAPAGTEIGHLSASLNTMLGQLEEAFADRAASEARMRTFLSDVSHELRTPLFGIKGSTELYRMGALTEQADIDETMQRIDREATRLTALTEDLLLLAQLDEAPDAQLDRAPMDLRTLAGNAAAHTPTGTPVRIGVGTIGGRAVLEVADDGPGMTAEHASHVFDRFYRANRSRNRSAGASAGLGLAIARSLARAHGGDIELETAFGAGALFRLVLPLLDEG